MTEQYLPWSPALNTYWTQVPRNGKDRCLADCGHLIDKHCCQHRDWRPARLYTPDEIAALERDREEWDLLRTMYHAFLGYTTPEALKKDFASKVHTMKGGE